MTIKKNTKKIFKSIFYTLIVLLIINVVGFIFYVINLNESINSFSYDNFQFYINGKETYNQFKLDYLLFNIILFLGITFYFFKNKFIKSFKNYNNEKNNF